MPIDLTLQRVDTDLAEGRVLPAIQRLRSLVHAYPDHLDVRSRLALVYRSQDERAQAGRWSFLTEDADPADLAAFHRAFASPRGRLAALAWSGDPGTLGPRATARLDTLRTEVARAADEDHVTPSRTSQVASGVGCALAVAVGVLALLGLVACVVQGVRVVAGWF